MGGRLQASDHPALMILSLSGIDDIVGACDEDRLFLFVSARQRGFTDRVWRGRPGARGLLHSLQHQKPFLFIVQESGTGAAAVCCLSARGNVNM